MSVSLPFSRRTFLAGAASATAGVSIGASLVRANAAMSAGASIQNPLVRQRADAQIFRHGDGQYYMTASVPEYDRLIIRRSPTLAGLSVAPEAVIWRRPKTGRLGGYIWAPELHMIDGGWHMYFAAGNADDPFHIRTYVLRCTGEDALRGKWNLLGQLQTPWDTFTLDSTSFVHRGARYLCWAQKEPGIDTNSNLYLAPLATPTTVGRAPVRLSIPTLPWEIQGFKVNEAPALLARKGKLFLTYSASATDARYCLGMLTADADADIMAAESWSKSPTPVFTTSTETGVYGPGHNAFTVDEMGRDMLVYHGRDYEQISGDPLFDPNRHTRVQRLYYDAEGVPDFGIPVGNGPLPSRFSPTDRQTAHLYHDGDRMMVGTAPLSRTQFREQPGTAGSVRLEPIDQPGRFLCRSGERVMLSPDDGTREFASQSSFRPQPGLSNPKGTSFAMASAPNEFLSIIDGKVRVAPVRNMTDRVNATLLPS